VSVATAEDLPPSPRGGVLARAGGRGYGGDPAAARGAPGEAELYRLKAEPHWHDEVGETGANHRRRRNRDKQPPSDFEEEMWLTRNLSTRLCSSAK
jgi:hypothetical protein